MSKDEPRGGKEITDQGGPRCGDGTSVKYGGGCSALAMGTTDRGEEDRTDIEPSVWRAFSARLVVVEKEHAEMYQSFYTCTIHETGWLTDNPRQGPSFLNDRHGNEWTTVATDHRQLTNSPHPRRGTRPSSVQLSSWGQDGLSTLLH